ncbi:MAG TPA: sulfite exporter TauE/SafE family protein [Verrucomicrobiae bacterium]|nr:sulfite exporter TauE/SafE family protein [Verrucomicrobiae bacterium]
MYHDLILFLTGIIVGAMNAIAGGGMLIGFPVMLALGIPALVANATTFVIVIPGNISSIYGYRQLLHKVPRHYAWLLIPTVMGAFIGAQALKHTSQGGFAHLIPWLILFAVVLFAFQPWLYKQLHQHLHGPKRKRNSLRPLWITGLALLPIATYGGFFATGFGFIMLAFLGFTGLHNHIHRMNALKNIIGLCLATTALLCLANAHVIDWRHGLVMGAGNFIGGYFAATRTQKVSSHALRIIVIIVGACAAIYLCLRNY